MTKLKTCPFCGGMALINDDPYAVEDTEERYWAFNIVCSKCCAASGLHASIEMAIEAWNRRVDNDLALSHT